jgi:hypothetical protein
MMIFIIYVSEKEQRRAINMVSNFQARNYEDKLKEAGMTTLGQRKERGIMTGKDDVHHPTWFQLLADRERGANTKAASGHLHVLPPIIFNSDVRRYFFSQRVVEKWKWKCNCLPDAVKMSVTVNQFKNSLDDFKAWGGHPSRRSHTQLWNLMTT